MAVVIDTESLMVIGSEGIRNGIKISARLSLVVDMYCGGCGKHSRVRGLSFVSGVR
jgi:hypothetical protein